METLAVIPKVHFKESQNCRIKGSWMEVFIHIEPRRLGGNTRTFAGVPILNLAFLPPHNPSFLWWSRTKQSSCDKLPAQLRDGVELMGWGVGGTGMEWPDTSGSRQQPAPANWAEGAQCWDSKSRLISSLMKTVTPDYSQRVAETNRFSGSGSLWNCFPNVWGLALQYIHALPQGIFPLIFRPQCILR